MATAANALMQLFDDPNFAWELLEWEIAIDMNDALSGQAIAKLLELYMKGVEKMNSVMDIRQSYFKNKVTSLMTKSAVVKTLTKPPMSKKEKPLEVQANKKEIKVVEKTKLPEVKAGKSGSQSKPISSFALQEKKREIEMRLAYEAQESTRENLNKLVSKHQQKEEVFQSKVRNIMDSHEERLKERINRRKLKTATYRSRPEDTNDTASKQMDLEVTQQKREMEESLTQAARRQGAKSQQKRFKSLQSIVQHQLTQNPSPMKRVRKSTFDTADITPSLEITRVKSDDPSTTPPTS